jgi:hypothetical protein
VKPYDIGCGRTHQCALSEVWYVAVDATEFTTARFDEHKTHRLAALRTDRRRGILGHRTLTLDQAGALPNSLSPNTAEDGAVMLRG